MRRPGVELSVVVATDGPPERLERCLGALQEAAAMTAVGKGRLEVVVVAWERSAETARLAPVVRGRDWVRFHAVSSDDGSASAPVERERSLPRLRGHGVALARGGSVAVLDDRYRVGTDWISAFRRSVPDGYDAVGGTVALDRDRAGPADWAVYLAEYGHLSSPRSTAPVEVDRLPEGNVLYGPGCREEVLRCLEAGLWGEEMHRRLRRAGRRLCLEPRARATLDDRGDLAARLCERYRTARDRAAARVGGDPRAGTLRRWKRALAALLLPPWLWARLVRHTVRSFRRGAGPSPASLPAVLALQALYTLPWAAGEGLGYALGSRSPLCRSATPGGTLARAGAPRSSERNRRGDGTLDAGNRRDAPRLSVIVASDVGIRTVRRCLDSLLPQVQERDAEVVVVQRHDPTGLADAGQLESELARTPGLRILRAPPDASIPDLRYRGAERSRGATLAFTEAGAVVRGGWVDGILRAAEEGHRFFGGPVDPDPGFDAVSHAAHVCEYGPLMSPVEGGPDRELTGFNAAYARTLLERCEESLRERHWETVLHREMRELGARPRLIPGIPLINARRYGLREFLRQRLAYGRDYGRVRCGRISRTAHLLYLVASPGLSLLMVWRYLGVFRTKGLPLGRFLSLLPLLALFATAWSAGEAWGYVHGFRRENRTP